MLEQGDETEHRVHHRPEDHRAEVAEQRPVQRAGGEGGEVCGVAKVSSGPQEKEQRGGKKERERERGAERSTGARVSLSQVLLSGTGDAEAGRQIHGSCACRPLLQHGFKQQVSGGAAGAPPPPSRTSCMH